jgi:peptide-methionine (S)-S-oxide reductase
MRAVKAAVAGIVALGIAAFAQSVAQQPAPAAPAARVVETAIFAGGCFWCVESDFDKVPGVLKTESGFTGGTVPNVTYEQVGKGNTGHAEAVRVTFDPSKVSYTQLLDYFWRHIDPTVKDRQFCDVGPEYRTAIFAQGSATRRRAGE